MSASARSANGWGNVRQDLSRGQGLAAAFIGMSQPDLSQHPQPHWLKPCRPSFLHVYTMALVLIASRLPIIPCMITQIKNGTWYNEGGKRRTRITQYHSIITATTGHKWSGEFARVGCSDFLEANLKHKPQLLTKSTGSTKYNHDGGWWLVLTVCVFYCDWDKI